MLKCLYAADNLCYIFNNLYEPAHKLMVLITYTQKPPTKALAEVSSWARGLNFGLSILQLPYFAHASSEGSNETAHMRRLF